MTERQRDKVTEIAIEIFHALDWGHVTRDDEGHLVSGLRYGASINPDSWSYLYYNDTRHLITKPIAYCDCKDTPVCKKFYVDKGGKKPEVIR